MGMDQVAEYEGSNGVEAAEATPWDDGGDVGMEMSAEDAVGVEGGAPFMVEEAVEDAASFADEETGEGDFVDAEGIFVDGEGVFMDAADEMSPVDPVTPAVSDNDVDPEGESVLEEACPAPLLAAAEPAIPHGPRLGAGGWTLPLLCAGIALIAACVLIPQADANRELAWENQRLTADLDQIDKQIAVNAEFLGRVAGDPTLAERLAQRQMKFIREGTSVLRLDGGTGKDMSPFSLVTIPPPPAMPELQPAGGVLASICRAPRVRVWVMGTALMLMAMGLVLGYAAPKQASAG